MKKYSGKLMTVGILRNAIGNIRERAHNLNYRFVLDSLGITHNELGNKIIWQDEIGM